MMLWVLIKHFSWEIKGKGWSKPDRWLDQTELGGLKLFFEQCLKGDSSDNIKGIAGIGLKRAQDILTGKETEQELFDVVRASYSNDEEFIMNASVLWIMRHEGDVWRDRFNAYI
jgi:hypothetical protein